MSHSIFRDLVMRDVWHEEHAADSKWDLWGWSLIWFKKIAANVSHDGKLLWFFFVVFYIFTSFRDTIKMYDRFKSGEISLWNSLLTSFFWCTLKVFKDFTYRSIMTAATTEQYFPLQLIALLCLAAFHKHVTSTFLKYLQLADKAFISDQN